MKWGGRRAQAWTRAVLARYGRTCWLRLDDRCTLVATTGDHVIPRSERPDLQYDVSNGRPACLHCNTSRGDGRRSPLVVVDARDFFESADPGGRDSAQSPPRTSGKTAVRVRFAGEGGRS